MVGQDTIAVSTALPALDDDRAPVQSGLYLLFWYYEYMHNQAPLQSVKLAIALRQSCIDEPYSVPRFYRDLIAGITVGIIAIPLAMALAIASGVPPQHGLYTAIIAGIVIAVTGGSRFSISGPTAAFVVILYPVAQQFGVGGLLMATLIRASFW